MPQVGELNERITLIAPGDLDDWGKPADGQSVTAWASINSIKAEDRAVGSAILTESTRIAVIRWLTGVTTAWRVSWRGAYYNITSVEDQGRQWLTLYLAAR